MTQFTGLAAHLGDLHKAIRGLQISLAHQEADLEARVLTITPAEGWLGKNEEMRKTARAAALAADETCRAIEIRISELRDEIANRLGEIEALIEQRDALRWSVTAKLADALEAKYSRKQIAMDEAVDEAAAEAWSLAHMSTKDMPF